MATWEQFTTCMQTQAQLDFEALDVAFIQPLKRLEAWWERQSAKTRAYVNFFTAGLGGTALAAFIAKVLRTTVGELSVAFAEALGAIIAGVALGLTITAMVQCGIRDVVL